MRRLTVCLTVAALCTLQAAAEDQPAYVPAMKAVHARFHGTPGTIACFGDSITSDQGFWSPLAAGGNNMNHRMQKAYDVARGCLKPECWKWKGKKYGNEGGMTSLWGRDNISQWLTNLNPEVVVLQFGSNDIDRKVTPEQSLADFEQAMTEIVQKCLSNGTIVIMGTIPPRNKRTSEEYNARARNIAETFHLPVCDFYRECLQRRPEDWNGRLPQFQEGMTDKFEVRTLISGDGEHPSRPKAFANDYSEEALKTSGYNLRTYLVLLSYADVLTQVIGVPEGKK